MSLQEILIELTIIAAAIWPLVRLCATPPFLRKLRSFPVMALGLIAVLPGIGFFLAVAVPRYPILLRITAISAGVWLLLTGLRARPGFGQSRQLPPGSLGVLPIGPLVDDRFFLRQANRHGPVFKTSQFWRPMICILGLERCQELLRRYDECMAPPALPFDRFVPGGFIRSMPAEVHDHYAPMMRVAFHGDELSKEDESIAITVRVGLNNMADLSAQSAGRGIAPRAHLEDMLFEFLLKRFFGVIPGSERLKRLRELYRTIDVRNPSGAIRSQALSALDAISGSVIESCRSMNNSTGPRPLFATIQDCGLDSERERVVLSNFIYIVQNARNDTAGLLVWVLKMLGDNPPWQARLIESARTPAKSADCGDLAKRIISETLRLEQSEFLFRTATADLECEGFVIPRGWLVRFCVRESHRDASIFDQPDKFDPDRFRDRSYSRTEYSPFGLATSRHICLGEQITRRVGQVFLKELASGYDWKVAHNGRREFDGWHWTPGSRFRVHLNRQGSR